MGRPKGSKNKPKEEVAETTQINAAQETEAKDDDQPSAGKPAYLSRAALIKEVNESNRARYAEEEGQTEDQEQESEEEPASEESQEEQQEQQEAAPEPEAPVAQEPEPPKKRKFVIDGVERELTDEEITVLVQKAGTVDARMA